MSALEDRYRSVLRMLPASYRQHWEEEMVATFLQTMHTDDIEEAEFRADFGRPPASEVASVAGLALRLRLGGIDAPPRSFLWGEAVRRVALVGLLVNAAGATTMALQNLWLSHLLWLPVPDEIAATQPEAASRVLDFTGLVWVAAYLALVLGHRRAAQSLAGLGLVAPVAEAIQSTVNQATRGVETAPLTLTWWGYFMVNTLLVVALASFHRDAPPLPRRSWLVALMVATVATSVPGLIFYQQVVSGGVERGVATSTLFDWPAVACISLVVAAVVHLGGPDPRRMDSAWSLALAGLAIAALMLRLVTWADPGSPPAGGTSAASTAAGLEAMAVAVSFVVLVLASTRALRRLPTVVGVGHDV